VVVDETVARSMATIEISTIRYVKSGLPYFQLTGND
jgi:hypothetical protein